MKQKIVIRVQMEDAKKRSKAMKVAVGVRGVLSAAIEGTDRNQIVVEGEGVDSVTLTTLLRKSMGFADLISLSTLGEKKEEKTTGSTVQPTVVWPSHAGGYPPQYCYVNDPRDHYQDPSCSIM